jgi:hypothetical protein
MNPLSEQLDDLAELLLDVSTSLDYYGGMNEAMQKRSKALMKVSAIVKIWAEETDTQHKNI